MFYSKTNVSPKLEFVIIFKYAKLNNILSEKSFFSPWTYDDSAKHLYKF